MTAQRIIEFSFSFLAAFLALVLLSLFSASPMLNEVKSEARSTWDDFRGSVAQRNEFLPGLIEGARGGLPGSGRLTEKVLEVRAVSMRATDPDEVAASVDAMEAHLLELERYVRSSPELLRHPLFATQLNNVQILTRRINSFRQDYNRTARLYNSLLKVFPQNLVAAAFGFVPLRGYPCGKATSTCADREWLGAGTSVMTTSWSTKRRAADVGTPTAAAP